MGINEMKLEAENGDAQAQQTLGLAYYNGEGVPQDYEQAAHWWRNAAAQGFAKAQFNLGNVYYTGCGAFKNYVQAAKWYRRAAAQGIAYAQYNLGYLYFNHQEVPRNLVIAYALCNIAAPYISFKRTYCDDLKKLMAPAEIAAAQVRAVELAKPGNFTKALDAYLAKEN